MLCWLVDECLTSDCFIVERQLISIAKFLLCCQILTYGRTSVNALLFNVEFWVIY
jgi:hypothetical protein